jgi:membrane-bound acyltransferase YfiQ involved in biofilm formation
MSTALMLFAGWSLAFVLGGYLAIEMSRRISAEEELSRLRRKLEASRRNRH